MYCHTKPMKTTKPYPQFFSPEISQDGQILTKPRGNGENVRFVPLMTSWSTGSFAAQSIQSLAERSKKLNIGKLPR